MILSQHFKSFFSQGRYRIGIWVVFVGTTYLIFFSEVNAGFLKRQSFWFVHKWEALHNDSTLREYTWRHKDTACGKHALAPDPRRDKQGYVHKAEINCSLNVPGNNHRLYPILSFPDCHYGPYDSTFWIWVDLPMSGSGGWVSLATYANKKNWMDLFGVNIEFDVGVKQLTLFHIPVLGKGDFIREKRLPIPMRQWVHVEVKVNPLGLIEVFQDRVRILSAWKDFGSRGPAICEAHWGLYAEGQIHRAVVMNDDISINMRN